MFFVCYFFAADKRRTAIAKEPTETYTNSTIEKLMRHLAGRVSTRTGDKKQNILKPNTHKRHKHNKQHISKHKRKSKQKPSLHLQTKSKLSHQMKPFFVGTQSWFSQPINMYIPKAKHDPFTDKPFQIEVQETSNDTNLVSNETDVELLANETGPLIVYTSGHNTSVRPNKTRKEPVTTAGQVFSSLFINRSMARNDVVPFVTQGMGKKNITKLSTVNMTSLHRGSHLQKPTINSMKQKSTNEKQIINQYLVTDISLQNRRKAALDQHASFPSSSSKSSLVSSSINVNEQDNSPFQLFVNVKNAHNEQINDKDINVEWLPQSKVNVDYKHFIEINEVNKKNKIGIAPSINPNLIEATLADSSMQSISLNSHSQKMFYVNVNDGLSDDDILDDITNKEERDFGIQPTVLSYKQNSPLQTLHILPTHTSSYTPRHHQTVLTNNIALTKHMDIISPTKSFLKGTPSTTSDILYKDQTKPELSKLEMDSIKQAIETHPAMKSLIHLVDDLIRNETNVANGMRRVNKLVEKLKKMVDNETNSKHQQDEKVKNISKLIIANQHQSTDGTVVKKLNKLMLIVEKLEQKDKNLLEKPVSITNAIHNVSTMTSSGFAELRKRLDYLISKISSNDQRKKLPNISFFTNNTKITEQFNMSALITENEAKQAREVITVPKMSLIKKIVAFEELKKKCNAEFTIYADYSIKAGFNAGTFHLVGKVNKSADCIDACCKFSKCNVAYLVGKACFIATCVDPALCQPVKSDETSLLIYINKTKNGKNIAKLKAPVVDSLMNGKSTHKPAIKSLTDKEIEKKPVINISFDDVFNPDQSINQLSAEPNKNCEDNEVEENKVLRGGWVAGEYRKHNQVKHINECRQLCCDWNDCNVAIIMVSCYNVKCKTKELCASIDSDISYFHPHLTVVREPIRSNHNSSLIFSKGKTLNASKHVTSKSKKGQSKFRKVKTSLTSKLIQSTPIHGQTTLLQTQSSFKKVQSTFKQITVKNVQPSLSSSDVVLKTTNNSNVNKEKLFMQLNILSELDENDTQLPYSSYRLAPIMPSTIEYQPHQSTKVNDITMQKYPLHHEQAFVGTSSLPIIHRTTISSSYESHMTIQSTGVFNAVMESERKPPDQVILNEKNINASKSIVLQTTASTNQRIPEKHPKELRPGEEDLEILEEMIGDKKVINEDENKQHFNKNKTYDHNSKKVHNSSNVNKVGSKRLDILESEKKHRKHNSHPLTPSTSKHNKSKEKEQYHNKLTTSPKLNDQNTHSSSRNLAEYGMSGSVPPTRKTLNKHRHKTTENQFVDDIPELSIVTDDDSYFLPLDKIMKTKKHSRKGKHHIKVNKHTTENPTNSSILESTTDAYDDADDPYKPKHLDKEYFPMKLYLPIHNVTTQKPVPVTPKHIKGKEKELIPFDEDSLYQFPTSPLPGGTTGGTTTQSVETLDDSNIHQHGQVLPYEYNVDLPNHRFEKPEINSKNDNKPVVDDDVIIHPNTEPTNPLVIFIEPTDTTLNGLFPDNSSFLSSPSVSTGQSVSSIRKHKFRPEETDNNCTMNKKLFNATLRNGLKAGLFSDRGRVESFDSCIKMCCRKPECNVVFMLKSRCYLITCTDPEKCLPVLSKSSYFEPRVAYVPKHGPHHEIFTKIYQEFYSKNYNSTNMTITKPVDITTVLKNSRQLTIDKQAMTQKNNPGMTSNVIINPHVKPGLIQAATVRVLPSVVTDYDVNVFTTIKPSLEVNLLTHHYETMYDRQPTLC